MLWKYVFCVIRIWFDLMNCDRVDLKKTIDCSWFFPDKETVSEDYIKMWIFAVVRTHIQEGQPND